LISAVAHHIQSAAATTLANASTRLTNASLVARGSSGSRLLLSLLSWLLLSWSLLRRGWYKGVLNAHGTFVDLREVVIFDGAGGSGSFRVNHGGGSQKLTELIGVKRGFNKGSTLTEKLLEVLAGHNAGVNVLYLKLALGHSALN
jgi:hypothetical protein